MPTPTKAQLEADFQAKQVAIKVRPTTEIVAGFQTLRRDLTGSFYEREDVIDAVLITLLAGENGFILGLPGAAKTELLQAVCSAFSGAEFFDILFDPQMGKEELFGALDWPLYKNTGVWRRDTTGSLYEAHIGFGDETFKAGASVLNLLLRAINEKQGKPGIRFEPIPLISFFGASNELPDVGLAAIWDRFLVRLRVEYLRQPGNVYKLLTKPFVPFGAPLLSLADLQHAVSTLVPNITLPDGIVESVIELRAALQQAGIAVSDRRWRKSMKLLRASAFIDGRDAVNDDDLAILRHILWDVEEQIDPVARVVLERTSPFVRVALGVMDDIHSITSQLEANRAAEVGVKSAYAGEALFRCNEMVKQIVRVKVDGEKAGRNVDKLDSVLGALLELRFKIMTEGLPGTDDERARSSAERGHAKAIQDA